MSNFADSIHYLENELYRTTYRSKRDVGLERARYLLGSVGNPQQSFRSVHITGSCGKGSTTAMISSILRAAGLVTGTFQSPHLVSYTERIAVNGVPISEADWARHFDALLPTIEGMRHNTLPGYDLGRPSLFEVFFAIAAMHFRECEVQWAALEGGIGGRLDAPTVVDSDVAVITNVSLEHTAILGSTVEAIAREKAAIIKPVAIAITASQEADALRVIAERAAEVRAKLRVVGHDITVETDPAGPFEQVLTLRQGATSLCARVHLTGSFQALNAACAFGAGVALAEQGAPVTLEAIRRGLESVEMPGRFELFRGRPDVLLDGAHNPAAAQALAETIDAVLPGRKIVEVFAAMGDKDTAKMASFLGPRAQTVVVTRAPGTHRAADPAVLAQDFAGLTPTILIEPDADRALERARRLAGEEGVVVVCGSLYLVGHLRPSLTTSAVQQ